MLGFIKKFFLTAMTFFNFNLSNVNSLECASRNNQECKIRTNETRHIKWHKTFATSFRCGCKQLTDKKMAIKDLFGILVIVSVNVINHMILENI